MLTNKPTIPQDTLYRIEEYVMKGAHPGGFLAALVQNDLCLTFRRADGRNVKCVESIYMLFYNYLPDRSYGSEEAFEEWRMLGGIQGMDGPEDNRERLENIFRKRLNEYRETHYVTA